MRTQLTVSADKHTKFDLFFVISKETDFFFYLRKRESPSFFVCFCFLKKVCIMQQGVYPTGTLFVSSLGSPLRKNEETSQLSLSLSLSLSL
jgi:hypothetical protein